MSAETWERFPPNNEVFRCALEISLAGDHSLRVWRTALTEAIQYQAPECDLRRACA